jgi:hypothetical protein
MVNTERITLMPVYKAYAKAKDTPNRKNRKSDRNKVFQANRKAKKVEKEARHALLNERG